MFRQLAVVALVACAFAAPVENYEDIPEEYRSLIPDEISQHLKAVTPEEKAVLKELAKRHKEFKDEDAFLAALKEKSPSLHEKAVKFHATIKAKVDALGEEAQTFVMKVIANAREIHQKYLAGEKPELSELKATVKKFVDKFKALSDSSKAEFKEQFPILTGVFTNPKIQALAGKYLEN